MDQSQQNELIAQFVNITQASPDDAAEYLAATEWDLQQGLSAFYAAGEQSPPASGERTLGGATVASGTGSGSGGASGHQQGSSDIASPSSRSKKQQSSSSRKFATLSDFSKDTRSSSSPAHSASDDDDDFDESGGLENFFTGGEKSGLAVQNPDSNQNAGHRLISDIFRRAQRNEIERGTDPDAPGSDGHARQVDPFRGEGFTLGGDNVPSQRVGGPSQASGGAAGSGYDLNDEESRVVRRLTFWRDGFSIEDGPLYRYDDPANMAYLQAIHSGRAPLALLNLQSGQSVDLRIHRRTDEDYKPPKKPVGGFHGHGNRLGSPVPGEPVFSPAPSSSQQPSTTSSTQSAAPAPNTPQGEGDTTVQIRLGTGSAQRVRFQSTGPVEQLYNYVDGHTDPSRPYVLQTTFPNKELTDRSISLKEAGVCGAVVVQKWS